MLATEKLGRGCFDNQQMHITAPKTIRPTPEAVAIIPDTGWVFNGKGEVTLISAVSNVTDCGSNPTRCPQH